MAPPRVKGKPPAEGPPAKKPRLDPIFCDALINLVRDNPHLWNSRDGKHSQRNIISNTWASISEKLRQPGKSMNLNRIIIIIVKKLILEDECKSRWKYLRDQYIQRRKQIPPPSGSGVDDLKEKADQKWSFFMKLDFLQSEVVFNEK